jgi:hypothetical protein
MKHANLDDCYKLLVRVTDACAQLAAEDVADEEARRAMAQCRSVCLDAIKLINQNSDSIAEYAGFCAEECTQCADFCESKTTESFHHCAEICRLCASECQELQRKLSRAA